MARILVTNFHPKGGGGHVPYVLTLTKHLNIGDNVIGVAVPRESLIYRFLSEASYPHLYECDFPWISDKTFYDVGRLKKFREIIRDFEPDIVHTNGVDLYTAIWSHPFKKPFKIIRTHHAVKAIKDDFYHRFIYEKSVAQNIFVSETSMKICLDSGINLPNSIVIENGIDTEFFKPPLKDKSLLPELGIDDDTFCFGSCAGTAPYKRVDTIIEAATRLKGARKFAIIVLGDAGHCERLIHLAAERGVREFVYAGFHKNVIPYVSLFDVGFVLSDAVETISFAAREMMAMGKPLLSSSYSGLSENITDGVNGFLVKAGDIDGIAVAMKKFLDMPPEELQSFSENARGKAVKSFGMDRMVELLSEVYSRTLEL